ncbi:hypothetical protein ZWY2020_037728 [Hordeum vulgare]|nr:hypothetical protein ZWY2020_037728 [Hordeum vulgare]
MPNKKIKRLRNCKIFTMNRNITIHGLNTFPQGQETKKLLLLRLDGRNLLAPNRPWLSPAGWSDLHLLFYWPWLEGMIRIEPTVLLVGGSEEVPNMFLVPLMLLALHARRRWCRGYRRRWGDYHGMARRWDRRQSRRSAPWKLSRGQIYMKRENAGSWNSGLEKKQILETYSAQLQKS